MAERLRKREDALSPLRLDDIKVVEVDNNLAGEITSTMFEIDQDSFNALVLTNPELINNQLFIVSPKQLPRTFF